MPVGSVLQHLLMEECNLAVDLSPLTALTRLTSLELVEFDALKDVSPLAALSGSLSRLVLRWCSNIEDLGCLSNIISLTDLGIR